MNALMFHLQQAAFRVIPEWRENWRAWPHCNGQARCWTHTESRWCDCRCRWCRVARRVRNYHRDTAKAAS